MLNHIVLMGRMTSDPEMKQTTGGISLASFTLAVDRDRKSKDTGERETDFIRCVAWRGPAEFAAKYFSKGSMAVVSGRLVIRPYTDDEGNKRSITEVEVEDLYFGEARKSSEGNFTSPTTNSTQASAGDFVELPRVDIPDGELLF